MWHFGPEIEIGRQVIGNIEDPILRSVLMEAHAERWGIFVGLWPVTLTNFELHCWKESQMTMVIGFNKLLKLKPQKKI